MATQFGQLGEFDPDTDKFTEYEERMEFFFIANDVPEESRAKTV